MRGFVTEVRDEEEVVTTVNMKGATLDAISSSTEERKDEETENAYVTYYYNGHSQLPISSKNLLLN